MKLQIEKLTGENSRLYGRLISLNDAAPAYQGTDFSFFKNLASITFDGNTGFSMVETYMDRSAELKWLEKHEMSEEVIISTDQNLILVLGTGADGTSPDTIRAFEMEAGSAFVVNKNIWHHAPVSAGAITKVGILLNESTPDKDLIKVDTESITLV